MPSPKPGSTTFTIQQATSLEDVKAVTALFNAYTTWLDLDLTFQDYASELASLPGKYAPPTGALLLARATSPGGSLGERMGEPLGCVGLRPLPFPPSSSTSPRRAEIKRLFTTPAARGLGLGKALVEAILHEARTLGYDEVALDTLPRMEAARGLYRSLGFSSIEAYYETPLEGTEFLRLQL